MNHIEITEKAKSIIYNDGEITFPDECCGFIYGKEEDGIRLISEAAPVHNSKEGDKKRRFEISPFDYMKAERYALEKGLELLGVYHSHPSHPAIASEHDLKVAMPFFSYVIISVYDAKTIDIKSWRLRDEERIFDEETVTISTNDSVIKK